MAYLYPQKNGIYGMSFTDAHGRRRRLSSGVRVKRVAEEILSATLTKVACREHLGTFDDSQVSFAHFADLWLARVRPTLQPRTFERWQGIVEKHLKPTFTGSLRGVSAAGVEEYRQRRLEAGAAPSTTNRELTVLKHMTARAREWEYLGTDRLHGRAGVRALPEPKGRCRYLVDDEPARLMEACLQAGRDGRHLQAFVVVALNTGMRRNEILGLTRRSVDWCNRSAYLPETKGGTPRHVRLNDSAIEALRSLPPRLDTDKLFPFTPNQASMAVKRALRRAGIKDCCLHDMRHSFASYLAISGVPQRGLQELLGHSDPRMTMRYTHLNDAYLRAAVDGLDATGRFKVGTHLAQGSAKE